MASSLRLISCTPIVAIVDAATNLSVKVDGQPVKNIVRVKSVAFPVTIPVDKVFGPNPCGTGVGLYSVYSPAMVSILYCLH
jgi:hypothetical protein